MLLAKRLPLALLAGPLLSGCGLLTFGVCPSRATRPVTPAELTGSHPDFVVDDARLRAEIAPFTSSVRSGDRAVMLPGELLLEEHEDRDLPWWSAFLIPLDILLLIPGLVVGVPLVDVNRSELTLVATDSKRHVVARGSSSSHRFTIGTFAYGFAAGDLGFTRPPDADFGAALQDLLDDLPASHGSTE